MTNISIAEYGYIGCDKVSTNKDKFTGVRNLCPALFKELHDYWFSDKTAQKVFTFENKQCLKATNYVGIIQTKNLSIEILPKIYSVENKEQEQNQDHEQLTRNIFISMLKPLLDINELQTNKANLSITHNKNIYEIFISMFINELKTLISKGLKSQYITKEENQYFLKGKLQFKEHIKQNYIHKERFYVSFDEYLQNTSENKLLKSCINLLLKTTKNNANKKHLRQQLFVFDEVKYSNNYDYDISKISLHRGNEYYKMPLMFAKVFLKHKSFSSLRGNNNVFALLFPMETVFEKYMEFVLNNSKDDLGIKNIFVNGKSEDYFLTNEKCKMTNLQPDYLLQMKDNTKFEYIVCDAKWKLLGELEKEYKEENTNTNENCKNISISSNDVYQMFAYLSFYNCDDTAYLLMPKVGDMQSATFEYQTNKNNVITKLDKKIKIIPINLNCVVRNNHKLKTSFLHSHTL